MPPWPTFGFALVSPQQGGPIAFGARFLSAVPSLDDAGSPRRALFGRSGQRSHIRVPTKGVRATDFDLTLEQRRQLFQSGVDAAERFFAKWNFQRYVRVYRLGTV